MSSIQLLRVLIDERLSAAAEEIFEAVKKIIVGHEEEILLSRRETRGQRGMLQTVSGSGYKFNADSDQPQLALSVWDDGLCPGLEESLNDEKSEVNPPGSQEEEEPNQQSLEDTTIRIIFTPPHEESELNLLQPEYETTQEEVEVKVEEDSLPGTSDEQNETNAEAEGESPPSSPATDVSDTEWRGSAISQSEDSESESDPERKSSCLPMAQKLNPTKKLGLRIYCQVCRKAFHAVVSLVNHMEVHPKDVCGVCGEHLETEEEFEVHVKTHVKAAVCGVCGKCFRTSSSLQTHMRVHTGEKPFLCNECGKTFNCRHNMIRHTRTHTGEKPYACIVCGKCFNDYSTLKRHLNIHKDKNDPVSGVKVENGEDGEKTVKISPQKKQQARTVCEVCGKAFHSIASLVNHVKSHSTNMCGVCGTHFDSEDSMKNHLKTHESGKVCAVCGKCFDSQRNLEMHIRIHTGEKPFLCNECGKSFNCRHNMTRHIRTHTGEKPYACTVCGKCFNDYSTLKRHLNIHKNNSDPTSANNIKNSPDGEKDVTSTPKKQQTRTVCEVCGKMFHSMVSLVNHAKSHSANTCGVCGIRFDSEDGVKNHLKTHKSGKLCEVCGKCFQSQKNLEMHIRVHTGEKPFLCNECGKSFNCHHNMTRHIRTHTGGKPYLCSVCGRCFSDHSSLKQHSSTHSGEKPHRCEICGKAFYRKAYLRLHMKSHSTEK